MRLSRVAHLLGPPFRRFFRVEAPDGFDALETLTPADFALVRRRATLTGQLDDAQVLQRLLADECKGRAGARGPVGFRAA